MLIGWAWNPQFVDSSISFHRLSAWVMVTGVVIHVAAHLADDALIDTEMTMREYLLDTQSGLSGLFLVLILGIMLIGGFWFVYLIPTWQANNALLAPMVLFRCQRYHSTSG